MNIKVLRKKKKIAQEVLAEHIGVSIRTIQNWEAGITAPNKSEVALLKTILLDENEPANISGNEETDIQTPTMTIAFLNGQVVLLKEQLKERDKEIARLNAELIRLGGGEGKE